jgi:hypothetical protein
VHYVVEEGGPRDGGHWTATWIGHLGGNWQLLLTDSAGAVKLDEPTQISSAYPRPGPGVLEALDVEVIPGTTWTQSGTASVWFSRPVKPWKRAPGEPAPSLAAS